jgi:hypothetical protein
MTHRFVAASARLACTSPRSRRGQPAVLQALSGGLGVVAAVEVYARPISGNSPNASKASRVSLNSGESWRLAGATTIPRGMPSAPREMVLGERPSPRSRSTRRACGARWSPNTPPRRSSNKRSRTPAPQPASGRLPCPVSDDGESQADGPSFALATGRRTVPKSVR